jgi:hypothetical protein
MKDENSETLIPIFKKMKGSFTSSLKQEFFKLKMNFKKRYFSTAKKWHDQNLLTKFFLIYEFPLNAVRDFTIPIPCESHWSKKKAVLHPVLTTFFFFWVTKCN